jgi:hypothetical protein
MSKQALSPLRDICDKLGVDPKMTRRIVIDVQGGQPVMAYVEMFADPDILEVVGGLGCVEVVRSPRVESESEPGGFVLVMRDWVENERLHRRIPSGDPVEHRGLAFVYAKANRVSMGNHHKLASQQLDCHEGRQCRRVALHEWR